MRTKTWMAGTSPAMTWRGRALALALVLSFTLSLAWIATAAAQSKPPRPQIPNSAMPGREREQILDKFPPPKTKTPPVISVYDAGKPKKKPKRKKRPQ
jgi:hypothetical protein